MTDIKKMLEEFLDKASPEELAAELEKGFRPELQKLSDPVFLVSEPKFSFPATVSFFQGVFGEQEASEEFQPRADCVRAAANHELALAA
jgi:hypothetical protein